WHAAVEEAERLGRAGVLHPDRVLEARDAGDLRAADLHALPRKTLDELLGGRGLADVHARAADEDDGLRLGEDVDLGKGDLLEVPLRDAEHLDLDGLAQVLVAAHVPADDAAEVEDVELVARGEPVGGVAHEAAERLAAAQDARDDVALLHGDPVAGGRLELGIERVLGQGADDDQLACLDGGLAVDLDRVRQLEGRGRRRDVFDFDLHSGSFNNSPVRWMTSAGAVPPGDVLLLTDAFGVSRSNRSLSKLSENFRSSVTFIFAGERSFSAQCFISRATTPWASRNGMPFFARYSAMSVAIICGSLAWSSIRSARTFMPSTASRMARSESR